MGKTRTFIAIDLPQTTKKELKSIQEYLGRSSYPISFSKQEKLHLTLLFLGDQDEEKIETVIKILESAISRNQKFSLSPKSLGAFPTNRWPKVVWIGVWGEIDKLSSLQKGIINNLKKAGISFEEESFKPHITLGKVKSYANRKIQRRIGEGLQRSSFSNLKEFKVGQITLYKSQRSSWGHVHTPLKKFILPN